MTKTLSILRKITYLPCTVKGSWITQIHVQWGPSIQHLFINKIKFIIFCTIILSKTVYFSFQNWVWLRLKHFLKVLVILYTVNSKLYCTSEKVHI